MRELTDIVGRVAKSGTWNEMARGADTRVEFTVSAPIGDDILTGTMDRIFRDGSGVWTIVDYKTDTVGENGLHDRAETYWPQIEFYALLAAKFFGISRIRTMLLFTSYPDRPLVREFGPDDLTRIEADIARVLSRIRAGEFAPGPTMCHGCPFAPAGCANLFASSLPR